MQLLKALVIGMGVLIVLAVGLLAYGLLTKTKSTPDQAETASFGSLALAGNAACRIEDATPEGQKLFVRLAPGNQGAPDLGCEKVIVIDMKTGAILGDVSLTP